MVAQVVGSVQEHHGSQQRTLTLRTKEV